MQLASSCARVLQPGRYITALNSRLSAGITTGRGKPEGYTPVRNDEAHSNDHAFGSFEAEGTADPATSASSRPTAAAQREKQHEMQHDSRPGGPVDASTDTAGIMPEAPGLPASGSHVPFTGTNREPFEEQKKSGLDTKV